MINSKNIFNKNKVIPTDTMIMSDNLQITMDTRKTRRNNNTLFVSDSRDEERYILSNLLQANCSYVVFDPNGEYLKSTGKYLQDNGYDIRILNFKDKKYSHKYNPFRYIRCDEDRSKLISIIHNEVLKVIPKLLTDKKYIKSIDNAAYALLEALFLYLEMETWPEDQNFKNFLKLLECAKDAYEDYASTLDLLFRDLKVRESEHIAVLKYELFKQIAGINAEAVAIYISVALSMFSSPELQEITNEDTIDLTSIGDKKTALFCIVPTYDYTYNYIVSMLYTQIFDSLCYHAEKDIETHKLPEHVRIFFGDTFDIEFFKFDTFEAKLASMRIFNMSYALTIRDLYSLKMKYKSEWELIVANCDNFILNNLSNDGGIQSLVKLNEEEIFDISGKGVQVFSGNINSKDKKNRAMCLKGKYISLPENLSIFYENEQCLVKVRNYIPILCNKIKIENHPKYHLIGIGDENKFDLIKLFTENKTEASACNTNNSIYVPSFSPKSKKEVSAFAIMSGVILGDIAGQPYEFNLFSKELKPDLPVDNLFKDKNHFTDDTVLSLATKFAVISSLSFGESYKFFGRRYPKAGYGAGFKKWLNEENAKAYNSCGNGSAMRVHYIGAAFDDVNDVIEQAKQSAIVTHNHPEGIKGAIVTAVCVWMARFGATKDEILNYVSQFYDESLCVDHPLVPLNNMRQQKIYIYEATTCQGAVPLAIRCFYESENYIDCLNKVISMYCDTDTVCAIAGGIAAAYYGTLGIDERTLLEKYLDEYLLQILSLY